MCIRDSINAASASPGLNTVFDCTWESYCRYTQLLEAIEGLDKSFKIISGIEYFFCSFKEKILFSLITGNSSSVHSHFFNKCLGGSLITL